MNSPLISIVIPCRNEEKFIGKVLEDICAQDYPTDNLEVIIVDGNSDDNTKSIAHGYKNRLINLIVLNNEYKTVPFALNKAIQQSKGTIIIRMDAHTEYSNNYVSKVMETFSMTGADIVGGPMRAAGKTDLQKSIAYCTSTIMGVGDSTFHDENAKGWVDSVYLGAWKKEIFASVGMFDVAMMRNQDDEFHYRARSKGKKIYLNPEIKSIYYPRDSVKGLLKQYFQYGQYKPLVLKKVRSGLQLRHLIPALFVIYILSLPLLFHLIGIISIALPVVYLAGILFFSNNNNLTIKQKILCPLIYFTIHVSYGLGFITGLFQLNK